MQRFCSGGLVGGGCASGSICVPSGANHCVMKAGSQLTCPANYTLQAVHYYTGFDDGPRTCSCACDRSGTGTCSGTPSVTLHVGACSSLAIPLSNLGCDNSASLSAFDHATATGVTVVGHTSCSVTTSQTGATTLLNEQTVCCTP